MSNISRHERIRQILIIFLFEFLFGIIFTIALQGMRARQQSMSITNSLLYALHHSLAPLFGMFLGFAVMAIFIYLVIGRGNSSAKTSFESGQNRWQRFRVSVIFFLLAAFLSLSGLMLYHKFSGQWHNVDLLYSFIWIASVILLIAFWWYSPGSERLLAMETGDGTRFNDERMQDVQEKAALTTIPVFLGFLVFILVPFEAIVEGKWPLRTFFYAIVLLVIWASARIYWNRRL